MATDIWDVEHNLEVLDSVLDPAIAEALAAEVPGHMRGRYNGQNNNGGFYMLAVKCSNAAAEDAVAHFKVGDCPAAIERLGAAAAWLVRAAAHCLAHAEGNGE